MNALDQVFAVGGHLWVEGKKIRYRIPREHSGLIEELRAHKDEVRAALMDENAREHYEERAAIGEYDGGLTRRKAEKQAARLVVQYKLTINKGWLLMLARPGDTLAQAKQSLKARFDDLLLDVRPYQRGEK